MTMSIGNIPKLDPREEHYWIAGPHAGLRLFLRRLDKVAALERETNSFQGALVRSKS